MFMHTLVGDKGTDNANPAKWGRRKGLDGCPPAPAPGHTPPTRARHPSQQHEGGEQQEGHEGASLTGHFLVLRLHAAPTAPPAATATTETEPGSGHHQEVEAGDDSAHHVASLVPHYLAGRQGGGAVLISSGSLPHRIPEGNQEGAMYTAGTFTSVLEPMQGACVLTVYHLTSGETALPGGQGSLQTPVNGRAVV